MQLSGPHLSPTALVNGASATMLTESDLDGCKNCRLFHLLKVVLNTGSVSVENILDCWLNFQCVNILCQPEVCEKCSCQSALSDVISTIGRIWVPLYLEASNPCCAKSLVAAIWLSLVLYLLVLALRDSA